MTSAPAAAPASPLAAFPICRNCDTPAPGNYCPACGQATSLHPPPVGKFIHEFVGHYVAIESALAQTLWALIARPGKLTTESLAGRKRQYVLPLKLYLTVSIASFVLIGFGGPFDGESFDQGERHQRYRDEKR